MRCYFHYPFKIGAVVIEEEDGAVTQVFFQDQNKILQGEERETPLLLQTAGELEEYFSGKRKDFTVPVRCRGTDFQKSVWRALERIPYGETRSYQEIAQAIGSPKACRAVGAANHRNPVSIIVPCHRVVGKSGDMTGYAGGMERKRFLLELERRNRTL